MATVLQLIDVRSIFSTYSKMVELSTNSRTLIVENPDSVNSRTLKTFALNAPVNTYNESSEINLASITTVMTCQQIIDRIDAHIIGSDDYFTAVVYAVVSLYDLDGSNLVFSRRWYLCPNSKYHNRISFLF